MMGDVEKIVLLCRSMGLECCFTDDECGVGETREDACEWHLATKHGPDSDVLTWLVERARRITSDASAVAIALSRVDAANA